MGWYVKELIQYANKISDGIHTTPEYVKNSEYFFINGNNLKKNKVVITEGTKCVSEKEYIKHKRELNKNSILMSINGTIGECAFYQGEKVILGKSAAYINCKDEHDVPFIFYNLHTDRSIYHFFSEHTGSTIMNLSLKSLKETPIPSPEINERKQIAEILSTWDKVIELKEKLIEEKKEFKKGLMQNLLTGKIRFSEFNEDWGQKKLGDIFSERKEINQNGSELLSITSSRGVIKRSEIGRKDNSNEDKSKYKKICCGDIGYNTMRMWQGVSAVSEYEGIVSPAYTVIKLKQDGDIYYFGSLFKLRKIINLFWRHSQGLVNDTLNLKYENFKIIKITVPTSKVEQEKISSTLKSIDTEISLIKAEKELLEKQKRGLMQLLLTGIVRVEVD